MRRFALCTLLALGGACRGAPATHRLVIALPIGPDSLVPNASEEEFARAVLENVYEPLVEIDSNLSLRPCLAESWHNPDDLTWIFHLRDAVRLHDGRLLDARMVAASLEKARAISEPEGELSRVAEITAADARTLRFRTRAPFAALPSRLSSVLVSADPLRPGERAVGTGPYRLQSWTPGASTVLEAFPAYRLGRPPIDVVEFQVVPDARERIRRLREGRVHLIVDVSPEEMAGLVSAPGIRTVSYGGLRALFLVMDCARESNPRVSGPTNPFRDARVRRALALAIDADDLVRRALGGYGERVNQLPTPKEFGYDPGLPRRSVDRAEARRLLAAAGRPRGFSAELDYMPGKYLAMEAVVRALAAELLEIGIRVDLRPAPPDVFLKRIQARDTALYVIGWLNDTASAEITYESMLHTPGGGLGIDNGGGYSNPELDRLIESASRSLNPGARALLLKRAAAIVYEDVPLVPLYRQADLYAYASRLAFEPRLDRRMRLAQLRSSE